MESVAYELNQCGLLIVALEFSAAGAVNRVAIVAVLWKFRIFWNGGLAALAVRTRFGIEGFADRFHRLRFALRFGHRERTPN